MSKLSFVNCIAKLTLHFSICQGFVLVQNGAFESKSKFLILFFYFNFTWISGINQWLWCINMVCCCFKFHKLRRIWSWFEVLAFKMADQGRQKKNKDNAWQHCKFDITCVAKCQKCQNRSAVLSKQGGVFINSNFLGWSNLSDLFI